jgi:hypothetical protein
MLGGCGAGALLPPPPKAADAPKASSSPPTPEPLQPSSASTRSSFSTKCAVSMPLERTSECDKHVQIFIERKVRPENSGDSLRGCEAARLRDA